MTDQHVDELLPRRIYWYAPFDNATEMELAQHLQRPGDHLAVETVSSRFGKPLPAVDVDFELVRDLLPPANEAFASPNRLRRAQVAIQRAVQRHRMVRGGRYDVVHLHTFNMFTDTVALRLLSRKAPLLILSVHNVRPHAQRGPRFVESLLHSAYRVPDHLIVAHENLKQRLVDEFRVDPTDVSVIPLPSPSVDRVDGSTEPQEVEFLFFGTLRDNKGIEDLLSAIRLVDPALPLRFVFAGRGEAHLEALLREQAAGDQRIHVEIGWIDEARQAELYSRAWAVVVPYTSAFAAQSGTVRVAYSFGAPVIASDVGALGAQVRADQSGWLVPERDPAALASCIEVAAASPQRRRELAATALQLGSERSARVLAGDFRALYDSLLIDRS